MNNAAVDTALDKMVRIELPDSWRTGEVRGRLCFGVGPGRGGGLG